MSQYDGWFYVCEKLGLTLEECLSKVSYVEYRMWMVRRQQEFDEPSRTDYYLMNIAYEIRYVLRKRIPGSSLKDFLLRFSKKPLAKQTPKDIETATALAKSRWRSKLQAPKKK